MWTCGLGRLIPEYLPSIFRDTTEALGKGMTGGGSRMVMLVLLKAKMLNGLGEWVFVLIAVITAAAVLRVAFGMLRAYYILRLRGGEHECCYDSIHPRAILILNTISYSHDVLPTRSPLRDLIQMRMFFDTELTRDEQAAHASRILALLAVLKYTQQRTPHVPLNSTTLHCTLCSLGILLSLTPGALQILVDPRRVICPRVHASFSDPVARPEIQLNLIPQPASLAEARTMTFPRATQVVERELCHGRRIEEPCQGVDEASLGHALSRRLVPRLAPPESWRYPRGYSPLYGSNSLPM